MNSTTATERDPAVMAAVVWWWHRAHLLNSPAQWEHTVSYLHGAILTHPDKEGIAIELRVLRGLAEEHAHISQQIEESATAELIDAIADIRMLQKQAD